MALRCRNRVDTVLHSFFLFFFYLNAHILILLQMHKLICVCAFSLCNGFLFLLVA